MIEFRLVDYDYPNGVRALSFISLSIREGDFVFLSGPTGAGKSTLLKLAHGQMKPTEGTVVVGGLDLRAATQSRLIALRRRVGFVFQDLKLLDERTVYENVAYVLEVVGAPRREIQRKVSKALSLVGLTHKTYKRVDHLSCGEQQRVAIARAIVNGPDILLADEPTGHVDQATGWDIMQIFQRIHKEGTTVVVSTHNPAWVDRMGKRVFELCGGRLVEEKNERGVKAVGLKDTPFLRT